MPSRRAPLALVALVLAAACNSNDAPSVDVGLGQPSAAPTSASPSAAPTTASPAPVVTLSPTASPKPKPPTYDVKAFQQLLTTQKYYIGAVDGKPGPAFASAVAAFQKVNGLYGDGVVGKKTLAALKHPAPLPKLRGSGKGVRVEVDLTKQVLLLVRDGAITRVLPVSSGSGEKYLTKKGNRATALSPIGYYSIQRRIVGVRKADLGTLYDPQYFYKGWAIHGSGSVPGYAASHGCIRVSRANGTWLLGQIGVGTRVYIYGGTHVFTAGSSAPGTDDPGGDTPDTTPNPTASPTTSPTAQPTVKPTPKPSPKPTASPTASPTPLLP